MMDNVSYRWINGVDATDEEWDRLEEILAVRGWMSLNRETPLRIRIAESDGRIIGFAILQWIPHTEPLWVMPSMRGSGVAEKLADDMLEFMVSIKARGWFVVADNPVAAKLCEDRGMTKVDSPVYIAK